MSDFLVNVRNLLLNRPPSHLRQTLRTLRNPAADLGSLIKRELNSEAKILVILGPWGSGKTTQVQMFLKENRSHYSSTERSYFSIQTLDEAYLHLLSVFRRFFSILLFAVGTFFVSVAFNDYAKRFADILSAQFGSASWFLVFSSVLSHNLVAAFVFGISAYCFATNKMKMAYTFSTALIDLVWIPLRRLAYLVTFRQVPKRIIVIEDLDRSSLSKEDRWALIANLWTWKTQYIIPIGYTTTEEKFAHHEWAAKIEASVISLSPDPHLNLEIAKKYDSTFPFEPGKWFGELSAREILSLIDDCKRQFGDNGAVYIRMIYMRVFFDALVGKIGLLEIDNGQLNVGTERQKPIFKLPGMVQRQNKILFSFGASCPISFITDLTPHLNERQKGASNWMEIIYYKVFIDRDDGEFEETVRSVPRGC